MNSYVQQIVGLVAILAVASVAYGSIADDNFDSYNAGDDYVAVDSDGWVQWSTLSKPVVQASHNTSSPHSLSGSNFTNFWMQNKLSGADVLNGEAGEEIVKIRFDIRARNAYHSPLIWQVGEEGAQDRAYFSVGSSSSWTYKYLGSPGANKGNAQVWSDVVDGAGDPLQVPHGGGGASWLSERFNTVELTFKYDQGAGNYGSSYSVQIWNDDGTEMAPLQDLVIIDKDSRDSGVIEQINWFGVAASGSNHHRWVDNLSIKATPEPGTLCLLGIGLGLLARRRR